MILGPLAEKVKKIFQSYILSLKTKKSFILLYCRLMESRFESPAVIN